MSFKLYEAARGLRDCRLAADVEGSKPVGNTSRGLKNIGCVQNSHANWVKMIILLALPLTSNLQGK